MAKQRTLQRYIFKIHSSRLRKARWDLTLPLTEARKNDEIISLSDSLMLRWIDELNHVGDAELEARRIKGDIKRIRKLPNTVPNRREIKRLYDQLDRIQFKPDYMDLIIDSEKDLYRACKGFKINGVKYVRLLGTNGGVKNSTIIFVSERLAPILRERIDNGRDQNVKLVPAKFEAYRALTCSGSIPVSMPRGIAVVDDCKTHFKERAITLSYEDEPEPTMAEVDDYEIELDESDGYGLMLPSLAERWSQELGLDYVASGVNTRLSFEKGMVFTFDFIRFADEVAGSRIIKDVWGNEVDLSNVELILTTSMLKLWSSYNSLEHYLACCEKNHYTFGITKVCPKELESRRSLNYQFIQSYRLTDAQIDQLIQPTIDEIRDVLSGDYRKALIFLAGMNCSAETVEHDNGAFVKALMADKHMFDDPFVKKKIMGMIRKRIDDAKIGVLDVHGNYSIICGDPYALCQSMFGLEVTGLLRAGEIYNKYWLDAGVEKVASFRAPMSCHNSIQAMSIAASAEAQYWYQYMTTCTLLNAWDSTAARLNGADKDGDMIMLTDDPILVENIIGTPTIFCQQRTATKVVVTEDDLIKANYASFGDDIGKITNRITSMFDIQAQYEPGSPEDEILAYRIMSGQLLQQDAIDKAKGIVSNPMPKHWYDLHSCRVDENASDEDKARQELNRRIAAFRKPYFMRYIYPDLMAQYNTYTKNTGLKCLCEFGMTIGELLAMPDSERTAEQAAFIAEYWKRMPVGDNGCVMNRICHKIERAFDGKGIVETGAPAFDPSIMKSGAEYTPYQYYAIKKLYDQHCKEVAEFAQEARRRRVPSDEVHCYTMSMRRRFQEDCQAACSNWLMLGDIIIDLCYKQAKSKSMVWDVAGDAVYQNLLNRNNGMIQFPVPSADGDIVYGGRTFKMDTKRSDEYERNHAE